MLSSLRKVIFTMSLLFTVLSFHACDLIEEIVVALGNTSLGNCLIEEIEDNQYITRFTFNASRRLLSSQLVSKAGGGGIINMVFSYNSNNQVMLIRAFSGTATSGTPLYSYEFSNYTNTTPLGNPRNITSTIGSATSGFTCSYNAQGRVTRRGSFLYDYNASGNLISIRNGAGSIVTEYSSYDTRRNPFLTIELRPYLLFTLAIAPDDNLFNLPVTYAINNPGRVTVPRTGNHTDYVYEYNSNNLPAHVTGHYSNANDLVLNWKFSYACKTVTVSTLTLTDLKGQPFSFTDELDEMTLDASGNIYVLQLNQVWKVTPTGVVTPFAGSSEPGYTDATGSSARFNTPKGIAADASGNVFVADAGNLRIRKITPAGIVTTLAGGGTGSFADGMGAAASFGGLDGLAIDNAGILYAGETRRSGSTLTLTSMAIRRITPAGVVSTVPGSIPPAPYMSGDDVRTPNGVAVTPDGRIFFANGTGGGFYNAVFEVTSSGIILTAGSTRNECNTDGIGSAVCMTEPLALASDPDGNLYISQNYNGGAVRKLIPATRLVNTIAGGVRIDFETQILDGSYSILDPDGAETNTRVASSKGVATQNPNLVYFSDKRFIRKIVTE